jgi:hypothetical protein
MPKCFFLARLSCSHHVATGTGFSYRSTLPDRLQPPRHKQRQRHLAAMHRNHVDQDGGLKGGSVLRDPWASSTDASFFAAAALLVNGVNPSRHVHGCSQAHSHRQRQQCNGLKSQPVSVGSVLSARSAWGQCSARVPVLSTALCGTAGTNIR